MNKSLERLTMVREKAGLNSKAFAEGIGLSASGLHNMYTRDSRVSKVLANSVELIHGFRAEWLLKGKGKKLVNDDINVLGWGFNKSWSNVKLTEQMKWLTLNHFALQHRFNDIERLVKRIPRRYLSEDKYN